MVMKKYKSKRRNLGARYFFYLAGGVFIFLLGFGALNIISSKDNDKIKQPYYSPEVFQVPKNFPTNVLGAKTRAFQIPILLYHYVEYNKDPKDTIRMSLTIRRDIFEKQVQDLLGGGYTFLTVADAGEIIRGAKGMPDRPVVLSFDDGYRDFYTDVLPILQFYNIKATLFVVSDFLNHSNNLTDEQMREIVRSGLVEVGGHTVSHLSLPSLAKERAIWEIENDKRYLEDHFGIKLTSFAYPYGGFDSGVIELVKKAGYKQAVSVVRGREQSLENLYFLDRIRPGGAVGQGLLREIER